MRESEGRAERNLGLKEKRYEISQLMKEKRSEETESLEEVFDRATLMIIYRMLNRGEIGKIFGVVKAGKESRLYWGLRSDEKEIAIKVYLTTSAQFRRGMISYVEGDSRFRRIGRDTRSLVYLWAQKEFKNLHLADASSVRVPKPIVVRGNVLLMEFVGRDGVPAPLMREAKIRAPLRVYNELVEYVGRLYSRAKIVHGDLSEYNVMMYRGNPVIFDFSQAVPVSHPMAETFLKRDLANLSHFFSKLNVHVASADEAYAKVVGREPEPS